MKFVVPSIPRTKQSRSSFNAGTNEVGIWSNPDTTHGKRR